MEHVLAQRIALQLAIISPNREDEIFFLDEFASETPKLATVLPSFSETTSPKSTQSQPKANLNEIFDWPKPARYLCFFTFLILNHPMIVAVFPGMNRD